MVTEDSWHLKTRGLTHDETEGKAPKHGSILARGRFGIVKMLGFLKQIYRNRSEPVDPDLQELVVRAESEEHVIELIMERAEEEIDLPPDDRSGGPPPVPLG